VWAPNLSHADGLFHLVCSNVSTYKDGFTDCADFLVTAPSVRGPWSAPIPLHARGFDASLFHDGPDNWLLDLVHDRRPGYGRSAGLEATRYDRAARRLGARGPCVLGRETAPAAVTWTEEGCRTPPRGCPNCACPHRTWPRRRLRRWSPPAPAGSGPANRRRTPDRPGSGTPTTSRARNRDRSGPPCGARPLPTGSRCASARPTCGCAAAVPRGAWPDRASSPAADQIRSLGFTGTFLGLWAWDLTGHAHPADFDRATYTVRASTSP